MANETLTIDVRNARATVIGKTRPDVNLTSGLDIELPDMPDIDIDDLDIDWDLYLDDIITPENIDERLPSEIRIMHVPDKTKYKDGDMIDLEGIVVQAYLEDGTVWQGIDGKYSDGYIPVNELEYDPQIIDAEGSGEYYFDEETGKTVRLYKNLSHSYYLNYDWKYKWSGTWFHKKLDYSASADYTAIESVFFINEASGYGYLIGKTSDAACDVVKTSWGTNECYTPPRSEDATHSYNFGNFGVRYLHDDVTKPYYWHDIYSNLKIGEHSSNDYMLPSVLAEIRGYDEYEISYESQGEGFEYTGLSGLPTSQNDDSNKLGEILYGSEPGNTITISWQRPYDNMPLTATFVITIETQSTDTDASDAPAPSA